MGKTHYYGAASGPSLNDCHFLGSRRNDRGDLEGAVFRREGNRTTLVHRFDGPMGSLCRLPDGPIYLTLADGKLLRGSVDGSVAWERVSVPFCAGVWGLDAEHVYAWKAKQLHIKTGDGWVSTDAPFRIHAVHGCNPDHIYVAGSVGVARIDGTELVPIDTGATRPFERLVVAGPDESYALSMKQMLWRGGPDGWSQWTKLPMGSRAIAVWKGQLWFGHERLGIGVVNEDGTNRWRKMDVPAFAFDTRGDLLIQTSGALLSSADGESFESIDTTDLERAFSPQKKSSPSTPKAPPADQTELLARIVEHTGLPEDDVARLLGELTGGDGKRPSVAQICKGLRKRGLRDEAMRYKYWSTVSRLVEQTGKPLAACQTAVIEAKGSIRKAKAALEG